MGINRGTSQLKTSEEKTQKHLEQGKLAAGFEKADHPNYQQHHETDVKEI